jgi:hypothetical protein
MSHRQVNVDASSDLGPFKGLRGVNAGPLPWTDRPGADRPDPFIEVSDRTGYRSLAADASEGYRLANMELVRVHDNYGPGDIYNNFQGTHEMADGTILEDASRNGLAMFPDLSADPSDNGSYNFGPTDELVAAIHAVGASPLFRLGASAGESIGVPDAFESDADFDHYADIARHVVLHYNKGWHSGFEYGVKYWELLNEPDGRFDARKYYKLYEKVARAVKDADPAALIGGPSLMFTYSGPEYEDDFLAYLRDNDVPLDFFTFHDYCVDSADPFYYTRVAKDMRALLDRHGFHDTTLVLDEWNVLGLDLNLLSLAGRAAFTASAIIYMEDSPLDAQTFYMGPNLFGEDGKTPNKVGQAMVALGRMKHTSTRLAVTGADTNGFAVQAGHSAESDEITVVISNYEVPTELRGPRATGDRLADMLNVLPRRELSYADNQGFNLSVTGLDPDMTYRVERYRTSDLWDYRLLSTDFMRGSELRVSGPLPAPSIETIVIRAEKTQTPA